MKKIILAVVITVFALSLAGCGLFGGNETTTTEDPANTTTVNYDIYYEINTVADLQAMQMNQSYILMQNLDLTDIEWTPIGSIEEPYLGNFDGNGYEIANLTITKDNLYNGLFGYVKGNIDDLVLTNASIDYDADFTTYAGAIAGYSNGDITNCSAESSIDVVNEDYSSYVGMLVGFTQGKLDSNTLITEFSPNIIDNNIVSGNITLYETELGFVGGLAGKTYNTTVSNNISTVTLEITTGAYKTYIGGLIGHNYGGIFNGYEDYVDEVNIYVENNIASANIHVDAGTADIALGGFIGYNMKGYNRDNYVESRIYNVVETSTSSANDYIIRIGGYFGEAWESQVEDVIINTIADLTSADTDTKVTGVLAGGDYLEYTPSNIYVVTPSYFETTGFQTGSSAELLISSFYTTLGWEEGFLDFIE